MVDTRVLSVSQMLIPIVFQELYY